MLITNMCVQGDEFLKLQAGTWLRKPKTWPLTLPDTKRAKEITAPRF